MAKKRALGRGLSALLENAENISRPKPVEEGSIGNVAGSIAMLKISQIEANPFQPRNNFKKTPLEELSKSITEHGIIQPVTVRMIANARYQLISGERRFRASQLAGLTEIPAYIRKADDQTMLEMALVENIQREDLDAIEVAISYQRLIEECKLTQESLSEKIGKNRSTVTNYLRLLKLPAEIQIGIIEKEISMGHARALVSINDGDFQLELFNRAIKDGLSVRQVEQLAKGNKSISSQNNRPTLSFELQKKSDKLKSIFGSDTSLKLKDSGQGKIEIPFKSETQLKEILDLLNL
ncbi:MAG: ParB/RepB/Spo0J family partition protein [Flavobacteriales bacterium]